MIADIIIVFGCLVWAVMFAEFLGDMWNLHKIRQWRRTHE